LKNGDKDGRTDKSDSVTAAVIARSLASAGIASKIVEDDDSARVAILDFTTEN